MIGESRTDWKRCTGVLTWGIAWNLLPERGCEGIIRNRLIHAVTTDHWP